MKMTNCWSKVTEHDQKQTISDFYIKKIYKYYFTFGSVCNTYSIKMWKFSTGINAGADRIRPTFLWPFWFLLGEFLDVLLTWSVRLTIEIGQELLPFWLNNRGFVLDFLTWTYGLTDIDTGTLLFSFVSLPLLAFDSCEEKKQEIFYLKRCI